VSKAEGKMPEVQHQLTKRGPYEYFGGYSQVDRILLENKEIVLRNLEHRPRRSMEDKSGSYVGQWNIKTGKREGLGVFFWSDGSLYEGFWLAGEASGRGRMLHDNGDVYEGEWREGQLHGKGTYYHHGDGTRFSGNWFEDTQSGTGLEQWPDGATFVG